jgi:hypothetical protein
MDDQVRCLLGLYYVVCLSPNIGDPIYYVTAPILEGFYNWNKKTFTRS